MPRVGPPAATCSSIVWGLDGFLAATRRRLGRPGGCAADRCRRPCRASRRRAGLPRSPPQARRRHRRRRSWASCLRGHARHGDGDASGRSMRPRPRSLRGLLVSLAVRADGSVSAALGFGAGLGLAAAACFGRDSPSAGSVEPSSAPSVAVAPAGPRSAASAATASPAATAAWRAGAWLSRRATARPRPGLGVGVCGRVCRWRRRIGIDVLGRRLGRRRRLRAASGLATGSGFGAGAGLEVFSAGASGGAFGFTWTLPQVEARRGESSVGGEVGAAGAAGVVSRSIRWITPLALREGRLHQGNGPEPSSAHGRNGWIVLHDGPRCGGSRAPGNVLFAPGMFLRPGARDRPRRPFGCLRRSRATSTIRITTPARAGFRPGGQICTEDTSTGASGRGAGPPAKLAVWVIWPTLPSPKNPASAG